VESYDTAILYYYMVVPKSDEDVVKKWEVEARRLTSSGKYGLLDAGLSSDNLLTEEVERMGTETAPLLVGAIVFMILFVVLTSLRYERSRSKPWEAMIGALIPIMANISAIGLMSACGLKFQSIVVCTLFLVQAVGCDGVFVMLRAWDVSKCHTDVVTRMAVTMKDAGPSITITSLTNALAFAVDIYSFTPAIQTFSIYSTAACVLCYIYQILLFSAVLALSGRREEKGMQAILWWRKADPKARYSALRWLKKFNADVIYRWSRIVTAWPTKIALVFVLLAYWYGALYGVLTMKTDLRVQKLALPNSYIVKYKDIHENAITAMQPLTIVVQQPGDLKNSTQLHRLKKLVKDYESTTFSYGSDSTFFWLSAYQEFLAFYADGDEEYFSYSEIPTFLKSASYSFWRAYLHINETACDNDQPDCVQQYIFNTGYHTVVKYTDMIPVLAEWRAIAANYSDLGVYAYTERALFTDQADQLADSIYTNVPMGLVCMVIVCIIFIPNVVSIVCAMLSVISISFGVFGYLSLSGVDLDPLSLAALLMSIGFSVDYTAHISYHYYKFTSKANPTERVEQTLKAIGWPTMQGGLATAFAMWPLLLKRSYLTTVFLKTVVLVVFLGLAHSMIVLPALLTCLDRFNCDKQGCKQKKSTPESINSSGSSSHTNISTICSSSTKNDSIS
uniref:SSD domain-containing protein n=1 Tax=Plectus sambesii TaxID=2011161 RepID=A0A914V285_9BILA